MKYLLMAFGLVALLAPLAVSKDTPAAKVLFNGKDLTGWDTWLGKPEKGTSGVDLGKPLGLNNDPLGVYSVVETDGKPAIRVSGQAFGAITSKEEFENYHLKFEIKWGEKRWPPREKAVRDSGLLYHCVGPHGAGSGFWMKSFESQIQENDFGDFYGVAGVIVDVEGERKSPKSAIVFKKGGETFKGVTDRIVRNPLSEKKLGEWNTVELYCYGQTSVHVNNGKVNMVMTNLRHKVQDKEVPLTKGKIQLQSEGAEVFFRNIEVRPLEKMPEELLK